MTTCFGLSGRLSNLICALLLVGLPAGCIWGQGSDPDPKAPDPPVSAVKQNPSESSKDSPPTEDKRVFGVFPNYRTTENSRPFQPITSKQKFMISLKDSFDWPVIPTSGAFAALHQIDNDNPSFGQGMSGYMKRWGTALADQVIGNVMTEGAIPALMHEDPRYFRLGTGTIWHRTTYALSRIVVTRTDSGGRSFNFAEWLGNATAVAVSNAYYPDSRTAGENAERLAVACATDALSQVMKEFWPDVKRKVFHRHDTENAPLISTR